MHLSSVHVRNYRNLKDVTATFESGLNVIVGENNIGKTNLLDAIRLALGSASGESVRVGREDRHRRADGAYVNEPIRVTLTFSGLTSDQRAEFIEVLNFKPEAPEQSPAEIRYEWTWPDEAKRWSIRRTGGGRSEGSVPDEVLQAIPVTILGALRDALVALSPGRNNRLGQLLRVSATKEDESSLKAIMKTANDALQGNRLIADTESKIVAALAGASGEMKQEAAIRASTPDFERIVTNLRLVLRERGLTTEGEPVLSELKSNGLGYNNLLYIATVLSELDAAKDATLPLLLVEEPEAHLHPQLQVLLADFLAQGGTQAEHRTRVQTIVTTHSPTMAAHVSPNLVRVLHRGTDGQPRCVALSSCGLDAQEMKQLRRMLDVTRASLLFARGVVLVEGISEALLMPVLASRLEPAVNLAGAGVSVVPMAGVAFAAIAKLFGEGRLTIPVAIVTDADPSVVSQDDVESPKVADDGFEISDRVAKLKAQVVGNTQVAVFHSQVTLEYDLAEAGLSNAETLFIAWESCYVRKPRALRRESLDEAATAREKALLIWRAVCRRDPTHGKAALAQALAGMLEDVDAGKPKVPVFVVPPYIEKALRHAVRRPPAQLVSTEASA